MRLRILFPALLLSINLSAQKDSSLNKLEQLLNRNFNPGISLGAGGIHPFFALPSFSIGFGYNSFDFGMIPTYYSISGGAQLKINVLLLSKGERYRRNFTLSGGIYTLDGPTYIFLLPGYNKTRLGGRHSIDFKAGYGRFISSREYRQYKWQYFPYAQLSITFYAFRFPN